MFYRPIDLPTYTSNLPTRVIVMEWNPQAPPTIWGTWSTAMLSHMGSALSLARRCLQGCVHRASTWYTHGRMKWYEQCTSFDVQVASLLALLLVLDKTRSSLAAVAVGVEFRIWRVALTWAAKGCGRMMTRQ